MKKRTRIIGLVAVALLALGAVGYAFRDRPAAAPGADSVATEPPLPSTDVSAAIGKALGQSNGATTLAPQAATDQASRAGVPSQAESKSVAAGPATAQSSGGSAPQGTVSDLGATDDRKIVQTASMRLQVKDVSGSFGDVGRIAATAGGFVASSNFAYQGDNQIATVSIRVPASKYQDVLAQVRALGVKVDGEASNASDVTEEYTDLGARQRALEATEAQLLQLLGQAKSVGDVLQVQDRLNSVRTQIEQVKGRMGLLDRLTDMATLTIELRPVAAAAKAATTGRGHDLGAEVTRAWDHSIDFLAGIAGGVISVAVFLWWVLPLLPLVWLVGRWLRARPRTASPAAYD